MNKTTDKQIEALKLALEDLRLVWEDRPSITAIREALVEQPVQQTIRCKHRRENNGVCPHHNLHCGWPKCNEPEQPAQQEPVTVLPDGSAFAVMSYPLPKDHWLYADRQYNDGEYEPVELGKPVLTHELRDAVVSAVRYAIRGATNCGKEVDFDPDALVQNAVYALCGPFTSPPASKPLTDEQITEHFKENVDTGSLLSFADGVRFAEAAHGIKGETK